MGKALYDRELAVEEHLGIDITNEIVADIGKIQPAVQQMVMSGDNTYQLVLAHCITNIDSMLLGDMLLDLTTIPIDFEAEWWNHEANDALAINDSIYYALSDYMLPDPNGMLFNKAMIDQYGLEDPYEIVREGKWTIDKLAEMASVVTEDNGDGVWDKKDKYGFTTPNGWLLNDFIYSSELSFMEKNDDGEFELVFGNERSYTLFEKLDALLNGPDCYSFPYAATADLNAPERFSIESGRCLFTIYTMNQLHLLRDTTVDFGILPYPKLDEGQDGYHVVEWSGLMCVPLTVENPDMVGKAIELLSYYSGETTVPAYFDLVLGGKLSRDEDSKEMLFIIFDGIVVDPGVNYLGFQTNMINFFNAPHFLSLKDEGDYWSGMSSFLAKYEQGVTYEITEFNKEIKNLNIQ